MPNMDTLPVVEKPVTNEYRFGERVSESRLDLRPINVATLQINVGKLCNQACRHCHVDAGPKRTEQMNRETAEQVIAVLAANHEIAVLDING